MAFIPADRTTLNPIPVRKILRAFVQSLPKPRTRSADEILAANARREAARQAVDRLLR